MKARILVLLLVSTSVIRAQIPTDEQKAADEGNASAQYSIGAKYFVGNGVPQDYTPTNLRDGCLFHRTN